MLYAISYLFSGFNIFGSAFFTGLNNGKISAIISTLRTLVIRTLRTADPPDIFGLNGITCAITAAELLTLIVTGSFLLQERKSIIIKLSYYQPSEKESCTDSFSQCQHQNKDCCIPDDPGTSHKDWKYIQDFCKCHRPAADKNPGK